MPEPRRRIQGSAVVRHPASDICRGTAGIARLHLGRGSAAIISSIPRGRCGGCGRARPARDYTGKGPSSGSANAGGSPPTPLLPEAPRRRVMKLRYLEFESVLGEPATVADTAAVIGRFGAGARLMLRPYATLRADGEHIRVGDDDYFGEHATSHIVDSKIGTTVGSHVTVGRFGVVHGCRLDDHVVVGEGAAVMDDAGVGPSALIAADSIVAPGKKLAGGWLYAGVPAKAVRAISSAELTRGARLIRAGDPPAVVRSSRLTSLSAGAATAPGSAPTPEGDPRSYYVAPTARLNGEVRLEADAGIYFGCLVDAGDGCIVIGPRSNV